MARTRRHTIAGNNDGASTSQSHTTTTANFFSLSATDKKRPLVMKQAFPAAIKNFLATVSDTNPFYSTKPLCYSELLREIATYHSLEIQSYREAGTAMFALTLHLYQRANAIDPSNMRANNAMATYRDFLLLHKHTYAQENEFRIQQSEELKALKTQDLDSFFWDTIINYSYQTLAQKKNNLGQTLVDVMEYLRRSPPLCQLQRDPNACCFDEAIDTLSKKIPKQTTDQPQRPHPMRRANTIV